MNFRTGAVIGAAGYPAGRGARAALRRLRPGRRLAAYYEDGLDRAVRRLTAKAERGGPLLKAALAGVRTLSEGEGPLRALLSFGWTALRETLAGIFGRGRNAHPTVVAEQIDIGAPRGPVYEQWTRFQDFPSFMKKVVSVDQVPDDHITWRADGRIDGTVSFHALGPDLTRVLLVIEYRPRGLSERTGNLWRAQGRRVRLELKHFRRHVVTRSLVRPERAAGRGEIHGGEVVDSPAGARASAR